MDGEAAAQARGTNEFSNQVQLELSLKFRNFRAGKDGGQSTNNGVFPGFCSSVRHLDRNTEPSVAFLRGGKVRLAVSALLITAFH